MQSVDLKFAIEQNVKFSKYTLGSIAATRLPQDVDVPDIDPTPDIIGGIISNGQLGWIASGSHIEFVTLKTGNRVASYTFDNSMLSNTLITCVTEIEIPELSGCVLAIGVQCSPIGGLLIIFAVQGSRVLRYIEIIDKITSCSFIPGNVCRENALVLFDGCVAVGTDMGKVIFVDLGLKHCKEILFGKRQLLSELQIQRSHIVLSNVDFNEIRSQHKRAVNEDINFGIQLEVLDDAGPVLSILPIPALSNVAVGLWDGRMILYDLIRLEAFHMAYPPEQDTPLLRLAFIEPADDPRACVYIWAFHSNGNTAIAVMHSVMFEKKELVNNEIIYKNFQSSSPRLTLPTFARSVIPVSCQAIFKSIPDEDSNMSLCLLAWVSATGGCVCLFDLNQWYKEQMPNICDWRDMPSFLACLPLEESGSLDIWLNPNSVIPFNSIQRPEEHFYPISLTFDCVMLTSVSAMRLYWAGLQNQILESFSRSGPNAILEPNKCYNDMICASLVPQFSDNGTNVVQQSIKIKQDFLLSIALEYNCVGLLKECAKAWANGSHLGQRPLAGLSLSSLTDWLWARATSIKERCNHLCSCLFDHSGCTLDYRSRKELWNCSRQLRLLADLLLTILTTCQHYIPAQIIDVLQSQRNSIQMASEYQEVLQWLFNMGLLPEGVWNDDNSDDNLVPYPYQILRNYYLARRRKFYELDRQWISAKTKNCRLLYIDMLIENECNAPLLRNEWKQGSVSSDGLYPPPSLQCMLRTLLIPGVPLEKKYMLFVYMFLDLNMALNDERYTGVVQNLIKFPAVFKLNPALIKITQAFWHLDHGEFATAVEELISPFSQGRHTNQWQQELLIESLLVQGVPHLALRALRAPGPPITPIYIVKTLLANNLIAEAFQLQRAKGGAELLEEFFRGCYEHNKWSSVLELDLTTVEESHLGDFLKKNHSSLSDNLHFVYLLQRCKYMEALSFIDDLQFSSKNKRRLDFETPHTILDSFKLTMTPATRQLSDLYYSIKDNTNLKLNKQRFMPIPLSSKLKQKNFGMAGGVYQRILLSTEQTTSSYWLNQKQQKCCNLPISDVPFLRNPQYDLNVYQQQNESNICRPEVFVPNKKRRLDNELDDEDSFRDYAGPKKRQRLDSMSRRKPPPPPPPINISLLTSFKDRAHFTPVKQSTQIAEDLDQIPMALGDTILSTPIVKSSKKDSYNYFNQSERPNTPQSILKVKGTTRESSVLTFSRSPSAMSLPRRASVEPDEKLIRFNLPEAQQSINEEIIEIVDDSIEFGDEIPSTSEQKYSNGKESSIATESLIADQVFIFEGNKASSDHVISDEEQNEMISSETTEKSLKSSRYSLRSSSSQQSERFSSGPNPRKRLHSSTPRQSIQRTMSKSESPEKSDLEINMDSISVRSRSEDRDLLKDKYPNRFPLGRRSYRSSVSNVSKRLNDRNTTPPRSSTPNKPKPLSRVVLETNAKRFSTSVGNAGSTDPINISMDLDSNLEESTMNDVSIISLVNKKPRLFTDTMDTDMAEAVKVSNATISTTADESFVKLLKKSNLFIDSTPFTTVEKDWSTLSHEDSTPIEEESSKALDSVDENSINQLSVDQTNHPIVYQSFSDEDANELKDGERENIILESKSLPDDPNFNEDELKPESTDQNAQEFGEVIELESDEDDDEDDNDDDDEQLNSSSGSDGEEIQHTDSEDEENYDNIDDMDEMDEEEIRAENEFEEDANILETDSSDDECDAEEPFDVNQINGGSHSNCSESQSQSDYDNSASSNDNNNDSSMDNMSNENEVIDVSSSSSSVSDVEENPLPIDAEIVEEECAEVKPTTANECDKMKFSEPIIQNLDEMPSIMVGDVGMNVPSQEYNQVKIPIEIESLVHQQVSDVKQCNNETVVIKTSDVIRETDEFAVQNSDDSRIISTDQNEENIQCELAVNQHDQKHTDEVKLDTENNVINVSDDTHIEAQDQLYSETILQRLDELPSVMVAVEETTIGKQPQSEVIEVHESLILEDVAMDPEQSNEIADTECEREKQPSIETTESNEKKRLEEANPVVDKSSVYHADVSEAHSTTDMTLIKSINSKTELLNEACVLSTTDISMTEDSQFLTASEAELTATVDEAQCLDIGFINETEMSTLNPQNSKAEKEHSPEPSTSFSSTKTTNYYECVDSTYKPEASTSRILRSNRSRSVDLEQTYTVSPAMRVRRTRAGSVSSMESKPNIFDSPSIGRQTRASSVPKGVQSSLLENSPTIMTRSFVRRLSMLEESHQDTATIVKTPKRTPRRTPSKESLQGIDSPISRSTRARSLVLDSPLKTPTRSLRRSQDSVDIPRRRTRQNSKDDADDTSSVGSVISVRSTRSSRTVKSKTNQGEMDDDDDGQKSVKSNRSVSRSKKITLPIISEDQVMEGIEDSYSDSRRLTRNQTAVLNKMKETMKKSYKTKINEQAIQEQDEERDDDVDSDTASHLSFTSSASKSRPKSRGKKTINKGTISEESEHIDQSSDADIDKAPIKKRLRKGSTSSNK